MMGKRIAKRRAEEMVLFFRGEITEGRIPTFSRAAERFGCAVGDLMRACRERTVFREAYEECRMMLVDHLIEGGLTKRLDASLVKMMLGELGGREGGGFGVYGCGEAIGEASAGSGVEVIVRVEEAGVEESEEGTLL